MTIGIARPFTSMRAVLEITEAEETTGQYGPQVQTELKVVDDGVNGDDNGVTFRDWFGLDENTGDVKPNTKAHQLVLATVGNRSFEVGDLVGLRFAAQVGTNKKGSHSKVIFDTIGPAPAPKPSKQVESDDEDLNHLEGIEALDL